jgi:polyphosphate kinase
MKTERFYDRDISWIEFNKRVLYQVNRNIPLAEKLMFLGIASDNLDEFMMSRYARRVNDKISTVSIEAVKEEIEDIQNMISDEYDTLISDKLILSHEQIILDEDKSILKNYFDKEVFPVIYPKKIKRKSLSPKSKEINILVELLDDDDYEYHNITIPECLSSFYYIEKYKAYIPIADIIILNLKKLFKGLKVKRHCVYMITRSVNMVYNTEAMDIYSMISKSLKELSTSWITSIACSEGFNKRSMGNVLKNFLYVEDETIYLSKVPLVGMHELKKLGDAHFTEEEKFRPMIQVKPFDNSTSAFDLIKERDRLVYHPFESFDNTVTKFIVDAANDPDVLSIKMTIYRISKKSKIIDALLLAAEQNKQVAVLVELKARFNEKDNLSVSRILKEAGIDIIYSDEKIKTHAKLCLVTRRENGKVKIYSHVSTGNYNEVNSRIYTDYSFFTSSMAIGNDLNKFFNMLTSPMEPFKSKEIIYAPHNLREEIKELIKDEVKKAQKNEPARIIMKCNSLTDEDVAASLYKASEAGVKIDLIVRGACIVKTNLKKVSDNITVTSIVGRFLEHSRVYVFGKGEDCKIYIGSSDIMQRNLSSRHELLINISDKDMKKRILRHLRAYKKDNINAHQLLKGSYVIKKDGLKFNSHDYFIKEAKKRNRP